MTRPTMAAVTILIDEMEPTRACYIEALADFSVCQSRYRLSTLEPIKLFYGI